MKDISGGLDGLLLRASRKAQAYILLLVIALLLLLVVGAQLVIYSSFERRTFVNELHRLQQQSDAMQVEWGQLLLEQSALTAYTRIETLVSSRLQMRTPQAHEVVMARQK